MNGLKIKIHVDDRELRSLFNRIKLDEQDLLDIEGAGAAVIVNAQRSLVPVDTSATKTSIGSHITESSDTRVVDEIGPETEYAVHLEYGTGEFAEGGKGRKGGWVYKDAKGFHFTLGMQPRPFVRPSVMNNVFSITNALNSGFIEVIRRKQ